MNYIGFLIFLCSTAVKTARYLYIHIHSSIIHNIQEVEATQVSTIGQMDKQNVLHAHM